MPLGLSVEKWQPKVGLAKYDIFAAYFVVEAKSKINGIYVLVKQSFTILSQNVCLINMHKFIY